MVFTKSASFDLFTDINLNNYVDDIDNEDTEIVWAANGNTDLTVSIVEGIATITIPSVDLNGSEKITFIANDGVYEYSNSATFSVNAVNDAPAVSDIPGQTIDEGATFATIDLNGYVEDIDNDDNEIIWAASGMTPVTVAL